MSTLPPSLARFEWQLERAARRHERRRRTVVRSAAAATAVVTLATAGSVVALVASESPPASAIERAQAALAGSDDAVLHVVERTVLTGPNSATSTSRTESWQLGTGSADWRQVTYDESGTRGRELGSAAGRFVVYNPITNTVHTTPADVVVPSRGPVGDAQRLLDAMRNAIAAGEAREAGESTIAGRRAIRIVTNDGTNVLIVDAETGKPIEWQSGVEGTGGVYDTATTRIETYEWLPANESTRALVSVVAQHPDATVVADG